MEYVELQSTAATPMAATTAPPVQFNYIHHPVPLSPLPPYQKE